MPRANLIIQSKVPHFVTLFDKLKHSHGSISAACVKSGLHTKSYYAMRDTHFLTAENARRIITAYQRLPKGIAQ